MYVDNNLILAGSVSASGTVTYQTPATTGSTLSTNTIDLGTARDLGEGKELDLRAQVGTAFTGATSVEFQLIASDDAAATTNIFLVATTGPIPIASLIAGARFAADINPRIGSKGQRYLTGRFVVVGTLTAGTAFMDIGLEVQDGQKYYPSGSTIL